MSVSLGQELPIYTRQPRLGFLGVGWIGRNRLDSIVRSQLAEVAVISDTSPEMIEQARTHAPSASLAADLEELLSHDLDAVVIATPSVLHAEQAIAALGHGMAVFCQKPLGRNATETRAVVDAARDADRLLGVDLSYRFIPGMAKIRELIRRGELGEIYGINLVFHNAYGPDKAWFYDRRLSGGGCLLDLGIHLIDLALWSMDWPAAQVLAAALHSSGRPVRDDSAVEDFAAAQLQLAGGAAVQVACSWKLPAGCDAVIEASFFGTRGGASLRNVNGSFFDFTAERFHGTRREMLSSPDDRWFGEAAVAWARELASSRKYDRETDHLVSAAEVIDQIYSQGSAL